MSFAVLGNNQSIKVNGAVNNQATPNATLYTAPANGYAIVQLTFTGTFTTRPSVSIGGNEIFPINTVYSSTEPMLLYIPTAQSLVTAGGTGGKVTVTGVSFINSP